MKIETKEQGTMPDLTVVITQPLGALGLVGEGAIHAPEITNEELMSLPEEVKKSMVSVGPNAVGHCLDGRGCEECLGGASPEPGPSVAGGPLTTAYAAAELTGWLGPNSKNTQSQKLEKVFNQLAASGIKPGNHVDRTAVENEFQSGKTGCGANDRASAIALQPYAMKDAVNAGTGILLGDSYSAAAMTFVDEAAIHTAYENWQPTMLLELLRTNDANSIEILEEQHEELLVIFNYVENTTFDRDDFLRRTGRQAFCVDMWYIEKIAKAMASGPNAEREYQQLRHAMTAHQVATYLTLTDGSQRAALVTAV